MSGFDGAEMGTWTMADNAAAQHWIYAPGSEMADAGFPISGRGTYRDRLDGLGLPHDIKDLGWWAHKGSNLGPAD